MPITQLFELGAWIFMSAQLTAPGMPRPQAPAIKAHPFVASYQTQSPSLPNGVIRGQMYRDFSGRTRIDVGLSGQEMRFIDDVSTNTLFIVDVSNGLYETDAYERPHAGWVFTNVRSTFTEEHRKIHGVDCIRVRFNPLGNTPGGADVGEAWISSALGIVMIDSDPSQDWKWEVTQIEFRQPDSGTFEVPADFRKSQ